MSKSPKEKKKMIDTHPEFHDPAFDPGTGEDIARDNERAAFARELSRNYIVPWEKAIEEGPKQFITESWAAVHKGIVCAIALKDGVWYRLEQGPTKIVAEARARIAKRGASE